MNKVQVILAENHAVVSKIIHEFLERMPDVEVVAEVRDGREVPQLVKRLKPDILILDILVPGMHATETVRELRDEEIPVQILILSDYADQAYMQEFLVDLGVAAYIVKGENPNILAEAIQAIADGKIEWLKERAAKQLGGL